MQRKLGGLASLTTWRGLVRWGGFGGIPGRGGRVPTLHFQKMAPPKCPKTFFGGSGVGKFEFETRSFCHMSSSFMVFHAVRVLHAYFPLMLGNRSKAATFKLGGSEVVCCFVAHLHTMHLVWPCTPSYPYYKIFVKHLQWIKYWNLNMRFCSRRKTIQRNFRVGICWFNRHSESRLVC